ncbi:MAG: DUF6599 family protein [candidate division Zixibacteria bacterium]
MIFMRSGIALIIAGLLILFACGEPPQDDTIKVLPLNNLPSGWTAADTVRTFVGEDLFILINGGAEIYHEYGFDRVYAQEFDFNGSRAVTVEVFQMNNGEAANGIYNYKVGDKEPNIEIGGEARLDQYYLNFRKERYLITLIGFSDEPEIIDGIIELAKLINDNIQIDSQ